MYFLLHNRVNLLNSTSPKGELWPASSSCLKQEVEVSHIFSYFICVGFKQLNHFPSNVSTLCYSQEFPKAPPCPWSQSPMRSWPPAPPMILQDPRCLQSQKTPNPKPPRGDLRWRNECSCYLHLTRSLGHKITLVLRRFLNSTQAICGHFLAPCS